MGSLVPLWNNFLGPEPILCLWNQKDRFQNHHRNAFGRHKVIFSLFLIPHVLQNNPFPPLSLPLSADIPCGLYTALTGDCSIISALCRVYMLGSYDHDVSIWQKLNKREKSMGPNRNKDGLLPWDLL